MKVENRAHSGAGTRAERPSELSAEVKRVAARLASLSPQSPVTNAAPGCSASEDSPAVSAETVRAAIAARRLRASFFDEQLFADPAWDVLLDLFHAELTQARVPVSSACIAAAVPATTALRWLKAMVDRGLFARRADPRDGRRVFIELTPPTSCAMRRYFAQAGKAAGL